MLRIFKGYLIILAAGMFMAAAVSIKFNQDMESARRSYINEERYKAIGVAKETEVVFRTVYQGLRIITRLPGVSDIDRYARNFNQVERQTVQEIYKSIAEIISISEIYIVPVDFDPDKFDRTTGKLQEPIIMFDALIAGKTALNKEIDKNSNGTKKYEIKEIETYEYATLFRQIKWLGEHFPSAKYLEKSSAPVAIGGSEIITCDNSRYDPSHPDDSDRMGLVYSLPFYNPQGQLKGTVSGILLSSVLREHLPNENYVLGNQYYRYFIGKNSSERNAPFREWIERRQPDPGLVYSEIVSLNIPDVYRGWYLWVGSPNENFNRNMDVIVARQFREFGYAGCFILTIGASLGYFIVRRHNDRLRLMNKALIEQQTLLEKSRDRIKKFSGRILSIREEEMKRLGRDLHDMVGSMAISMNARISVAEGNIKNRQSEKALHNLYDSRKILDEIVKSFKKIAISLRPPQLETVGLSGALREYCSEVAALAGLDLEFKVDIRDDKISEGVAIALYRVVQEAMTNIVKHARAKKCSVHMYEEGPTLNLIISDDGAGLDSKDIEFYSQKSKMGLLGIRERVESFGGDLIIRSEYGQGTEISILIPFKAV